MVAAASRSGFVWRAAIASPLAFARASELIKDLHQLDISPATLLEWVHDAAQLLIPTVQAIAQSVQAAPVVHVDESDLARSVSPAVAAYCRDRHPHLVRGASQAGHASHRGSWDFAQLRGHAGPRLLGPLLEPEL